MKRTKGALGLVLLCGLLGGPVATQGAKLELVVQTGHTGEVRRAWR